MKYNNYRARLKERFKSQLIAADCDCEQAFNIIKKSKQNRNDTCQLNDESMKNLPFLHCYTTFNMFQFMLEITVT